MKEDPSRVGPPDKRLRFPRSDLVKEPHISRRIFLGGGAAWAAASMTPESILERLANVASIGSDAPIDKKIEKQKALDAAIAAVQKNLKDPSVQDALAGNGEAPFSKIFRAIEIPILPEHLIGTSYDVTEARERYPVQFGLHKNKAAAFKDRLQITPSDSRDGHAEFLSEEDGGYGNGVFWENKHTLLTAKHVVNSFLLGTGWTPPKNETDIALVDVGATNSARYDDCIMRDDPRLTNANIHGSFVATVGIDPDSTKDSTGRKTYPGVAVRMNEKLVRALAANGPLDPLFMQAAERSFMVVLPPGEAKIRENKKWMPAQGMSGSPVVIQRADGTSALAGILWGAARINEGNRSVEVMFFHGIDDIRAATKNISVAKLP